MLYWICKNNLSFFNLKKLVYRKIKLKLTKFENKISKKEVRSSTKLTPKSRSLTPYKILDSTLFMYIREHKQA